MGLGKGMWAHSEIQIIFLRTLALPTVQIWALNTSRKSSWTPPHTHTSPDCLHWRGYLRPAGHPGGGALEPFLQRWRPCLHKLYFSPSKG